METNAAVGVYQLPRHLCYALPEHRGPFGAEAMWNGQRLVVLFVYVFFLSFQGTFLSFLFLLWCFYVFLVFSRNLSKFMVAFPSFFNVSFFLFGDFTMSDFLQQKHVQREVVQA